MNISNAFFYDEILHFFKSLNIVFEQHYKSNFLLIELQNKRFGFYPLFANTYPISESIQSVVIHQDVWITKNSQVKSRIKSLLGLNKKIHARLCTVRQIDKLQAQCFLNENHLGGYCKCAYKFGLFFNTELYAVATFSKGRKMNRLKEEQRSYELLSFATKANFTIVGGLDKLISFFTIIKLPDDIMTYIDLEWSNGKSFTKLGFEIVGETLPITFFIDEKYVRHKTALIENSMNKIQNKGNLKLVKNCAK